MSTLLPDRTGAASIEDSATTVGQQKTNLGKLRDFLADLFGTTTATLQTAWQTFRLQEPGQVANASLTFSVGSSALTIALKTRAGANASATDPVIIGQRSATAGNGDYNQRTVTAALSLVVSSGSTLGLASNEPSYLYVYLIDNAGTQELAISKTWLGPAGIVSTTAEGGAGAADSGSVAYSTTSRSNVPFRALARLVAPQSTAGTWAAVPTTCQLWPFDPPGVVAPNLFYAGLQAAWASTTTVTLGTGRARDTGDTFDLAIASASTGTLQAAGAWAAGSGANKLDTGARANSTWYHAHLIRKISDATADWLLSTSATSGGVTLPTGYAYGRRIKGGQFKTDGSGNIIKTLARGQAGQALDVPVQDITTAAGTNPGTAAVTRTLASIPTGIRVRPVANERHVNATNNHYWLTTSLDQTDTTPSSSVFSGYAYNSANSSSHHAPVTATTNTSAQVRTRQSASGASDTLDITTHGWFDDVEVD